MAITGIKLRCPLAACHGLKVTASAAETGGAMDKYEDTIGVFFEDLASGAEGALVFFAPKILLPKTDGSGIDFAAGETLYYDNTAKEVTNVSGGNTACGIALEAADDDDTEVLAYFDGSPKS